MRAFKRRRTVALGVLVSATALAVFVLPASPAAAGTATFPNACINSVTANNSQISVTMSGDSPAQAAPGSTFALSNITQTLDVPPDIFVAGYRIFLYGTGPLTVPADVQTLIEGTNTAEGTQFTNVASGSISTVISDPTPANRNSGDETATPGVLSVSYNDQTWTAGASGTINFREETVQPLAQNTGGIVINAVVGGQIPVQFACSPGTVAGSMPGVITFDDPAASFATTEIVQPPGPTISIDDVTVAEGDSGQTPADFTVSLSEASAEQVTVDFATSDGTATAPSDYASDTGTVTFAPGDTEETVTVQVNGDTVDEPDETFNVDLSNAQGGGATIADDQGVGTITDDDPPPDGNEPPDCSAVTASPDTLWPPNHKLRSVTLSGASDPDGDPVALTVTGVTQDEPLNGRGDGNTAPDAEPGASPDEVLLRAERIGKGDGRVYEITFTGDDGQGGSCQGTTTVGVPHHRGKDPVDSGQTVDSFGP
jgi:Calx-beta domain